MQMMKREITKMILAMCFTFFILAVYCWYSYFQQKNSLISQIDKQLLAAAAAIPYVLSDDFHDRCFDAASIDASEDQKNIIALSALARKLDMKFLYTVIMDKNSTYRLSSSSATDEELASGQEIHYYENYSDVTILIKRAFDNPNTHFTLPSADNVPIYVPIYSYRWGTYRSAFLPLRSPGG